MKFDDKIMQAIPLMAPVPTAWMIGVSTSALMGFPLPVSIITALTVEGLGFVSINTANEMREFNRHLNAVEIKQKMEAPVRQAYGVAGLYLATATVMTVVLHIFPTLVVYAPLPFIAMTAAGGWLFALRKEHQDRVEKWEQGRSAATLKRRSAKTSDAGKSLSEGAATVSDAGSDAQRPSATLKRRSSDAQRRSAKVSATIYRCECGEQYTNRFKYSGHVGRCAVHKDAQSRLIPVEIPQNTKVQS
jgi:hypothetical protein